MKNLLAIALAVFTLLLIGAGAFLTSEIRPLPGTPGVVPASAAPSLEQTHTLMGWLVVALTLAVAVLTRRALAWIALALILVESMLGSRGPTLHAILAPVFFSITVALWVLTSRGWAEGPVPVENVWAPLRPMAFIAPVLVLVQIGLGAAFRHNHMGVLSHILNAMIVLLLILVVGICVVRQYPDHPSLRPAAIALLVIAGIQVLLGFGVYMALLVSSENNLGIIVPASIHVVAGALTLAAAVVLAMQVQRNFSKYAPSHTMTESQR